MKSFDDYLNPLKKEYFNLEQSKYLLNDLLSKYAYRKLTSDSRKKLNCQDKFISIYTNKWNEYFESIPKNISKQSMHYTQSYLLSAVYIWERIIFGSDIKWSESIIDIVKDYIEDYFNLPEKTVYWFMSADYGKFELLTKFEKTDPERKLLYKIAWELYQQKITEKNLSRYTYIRALEDANNKYKIIDLEKVDFYNLEQGFKVWRKKNLRTK